jgi:hypothetical protein
MQNNVDGTTPFNSESDTLSFRQITDRVLGAITRAGRGRAHELPWSRRVKSYDHHQPVFTCVITQRRASRKADRHP